MTCAAIRVSVLAGLIALACAPAAEHGKVGAPSQNGDVVTVRETRSGKRALVAEVEGNIVTVHASKPTECQWVVRKVVGGRAAGPVLKRSDWKVCESSPLANKHLVLTVAGSFVEQTTDRSGTARFDLTSVRDVRGAPVSATVSFDDSSGVQIDVRVDGSPAYAGWRKTEQDAPREKAEREQQQATAKYARELKLLEKVEAGLPQIKGKWDDAKVTLFGEMVQNLKSISGDSFAPSEKARLATAVARVASLVESYNALVRAAQAERDAEALKLGRRAVLRSLRSPSTAKFVNDAVFATCGNGILTTVHEVDAQNGFGAMVRDKQCALVDVNSGAGIPAACGGMVGVLSIAQPSAEMCGNFRAFIARGFY